MYSLHLIVTVALQFLIAQICFVQFPNFESKLLLNAGFYHDTRICWTYITVCSPIENLAYVCMHLV